MGKTWGHPELMAIFGAQDRANPFAKGWRALADIDSDVEHLTHGCPHQLTLSLVKLIMQPAQDTLPGTGMVVLHEILVPAEGIKL